MIEDDPFAPWRKMTEEWLALQKAKLASRPQPEPPKPKPKSAPSPAPSTPTIPDWGRGGRRAFPIGNTVGGK